MRTFKIPTTPTSAGVLAGFAVGALALSGCTASSSPTVTQTTTSASAIEAHVSATPTHDLPRAAYADSAGVIPGYVMTATDNAQGFSGTITFHYEDGRTGEDYQYTATLADSTGFVMRLSNGRSVDGSFKQNSLTLADCGSYLSWADPSAHPGTPPFSCTFEVTSSGQ